MSQEFKEFTGNESPEEFAAYCKELGYDVTQPQEDFAEGELSAEQLDAVAGGMSTVKAYMVVYTSYYECLRYGRTKTYSSKTINEAVSQCQGSWKSDAKYLAGVLMKLLKKM